MVRGATRRRPPPVGAVRRHGLTGRATTGATRCAASCGTLGLLLDFQQRADADHAVPCYRRRTRAELAALMRTWPRWAVIVLPPVVVHACAEAAIRRFLALGGAPDVTIGPGFGRGDLAVSCGMPSR